MIQFNVLNRYSSNVQFTAKIACRENVSRALKLGLAIRWAIRNNTNLRGADLGGADLGGTYLEEADLEGADLRGADLGEADLTGADLGGADLVGAYLRGAYLRGAYLRGAYLGRADLRGAYLGGGKFGGAYLGGADLRGAYLGGADLTGAYLGGADLRGAYLGDNFKIFDYIYFGPLGKSNWQGIAYISQEGELIVSLGYHFEEPKQAYRAIRDKYGSNSNYESAIKFAVKYLKNKYNNHGEDDDKSRDPIH